MRPAILLSLAAALHGQTPEMVLRTESRVVEIDVVAKDKNGRPVADLGRADFRVFDNGKPREFQIFSYNGGAPAPPTTAARPAVALPPHMFSNTNGPPADLSAHSTVILLDHVNGWFDNAGIARQNVLSLIDKAPADERIALYVLVKDRGLAVLQEYTTDRELLRRRMSAYLPRGMQPAPVGMDNLGLAMRDTGDAGPRDPGQRTLPKPTEATAREKEYDQRQASEMVRLSLSTLARELARTPGRKSVYWVTQGFQPQQMRGMGSDAWEHTLRSLSDANVAVNAVDSNGLGGPPRRWGPGQILSMLQVAEATGGKAYYNRNDLDEAMRQGIEDARATYTLGFYLGEGERDGRFHRLDVRVDRRGMELHFRPGYFAGGDRAAGSAKKGDEMESLLVSPVDSADVAIVARVSATPGALEIRVAPDVKTVSLKQQVDGWMGKVNELLVEMDAGGRVLAKVSDTRQFTIPGATRAAAEQHGLAWSMRIRRAEGAVRLVIVIQDAATGRSGSLTAPLGQ